MRTSEEKWKEVENYCRAAGVNSVHPLTVCTGGLLTQSGCRLHGLVLGKMAQ
jgi:hypothetical protein